ncbi:MAG: phytase [bacterium]
MKVLNVLLTVTVFAFIASSVAGQVSGRAAGDSLTFVPTDDGQVKSTRPAKNYGTKSTTKVERGLFNTYLKFDVTGIHAAVQHARLRLFVVEESNDGGALYLVSNNYLNTDAPWDEGGLTWNNAPTIADSVVSTLRLVTANTFVEFDVTAAISGDTTYSFAIRNGSTDRVQYSTKEGSHAPELIIETGVGKRNASPLAVDDKYVSEDSQSLVVSAPGVLENDRDPDGDFITATQASQPTHGSLVLNADGSFVFTPDAGFLGTDKFMYTVSDSSGGTAVGLVAVTFTFNDSARAAIVDPAISTNPTTGTADDPALWIHPTNSARSIIIGTDKVAGIFVWDLNGTELQHIEQGTQSNNVEVKTGVVFAGERVDIVAANLRGAGKLAVFKVNPDYTGSDVLVQIADMNSENNDIQADSYGFGLYRRPADGALFVFERPKNEGAIRQYRIVDDGTPNGVLVTPVRDLNYSGGVAEGFVVDDEMGFIYISEEAKGVHKYLVDPAMSSDPIALFATDDGIAGDREGLGLYACSDSTGYLLLSSQGNSTIKIYERQGDNRFLKTVIPANADGDFGLGTDGLDVTSSAAGPNLPNGFVVVHEEAGSRFHVYDWARFAGDDLTICVNGDVPGNGQNAAPIAVDDSLTTSVGAAVDIQVTANDRDPDGTIEGSTVLIVEPPLNGTAVVSSSEGVVTYTPNSNFVGRDLFSYTVADDDGARSNPANVTVTVSNDANINTFSFRATDDAHVKSTKPTTNYGDRLSLKVDAPLFHSYVKFRVSELSGPVQSARIRLFAINGSSDGGSIYSVSNNYKDSLTPWKEDSLHFSNAPDIMAPPISSAGAVGTGEIVEFDVTDVITAEGIYSFGILNQSTDKAEYSSDEGANPPELIVQAGSDGIGNLPPIALDDSATTMIERPVTIDVLANDSDPDDTLDVSTVAIVSPPASGSITTDMATGRVTYTPNNGFTGRDMFTYTVKDNTGELSNPAAVSVTVLTGARTLSFVPTDDVHVKSSYPTQNAGRRSTARVQKDVYKTYIKFKVEGLRERVQGAYLRLFVVDGSDQGGMIYLVSNNYVDSSTAWEENQLMWSNAPLVAGASLSVVKEAKAHTLVAFDVKSAIPGNGIYSFAIVSTSLDKVAYSTKEGVSPPVLILVESPSSPNPDEAEQTLATAAEHDKTTPRMPQQIALSPTYPNPFNLETRLEYGVPEQAKVQLTIYNVRGQQVRKLVDEIQPPGYKKVFWNGKDNTGNVVGSGVYFLQLVVNKQILTRKLTLQK